MLDAANLAYPAMRHGMDHDRYAWSPLHERAAVQWPGGKALAVWVNVSIEHFPLNPVGKPVKLPGSMTMPYPDLRHFSLRDYGNRVGVYRFLKALDRFHVPFSAAVNAACIERHPYLMGELSARVRAGSCEIWGHSWSMDTPHCGGVDAATEAETIDRSLNALRERFGKPITGWLSPGKLQSPNTPDLLATQGIRCIGDWVNDDMPYPFHTAHGDVWNLPLSTELEDRFVLLDNLHDEASWAQQVMDAMDFLIAEAKRCNAGRMLGLNIHPWVMGQPHRMKHLEAVLQRAAGSADVWMATPQQVCRALDAL